MCHFRSIKMFIVSKIITIFILTVGILSIDKNNALRLRSGTEELHESSSRLQPEPEIIESQAEKFLSELNIFLEDVFNEIAEDVFNQAVHVASIYADNVPTRSIAGRNPGSCFVGETFCSIETFRSYKHSPRRIHASGAYCSFARGDTIELKMAYFLFSWFIAEKREKEKLKKLKNVSAESAAIKRAIEIPKINAIQRAKEIPSPLKAYETNLTEKIIAASKRASKQRQQMVTCFYRSRPIQNDGVSVTHIRNMADLIGRPPWQQISQIGESNYRAMMKLKEIVRKLCAEDKIGLSTDLDVQMPLPDNVNATEWIYAHGRWQRNEVGRRRDVIDRVWREGPGGSRRLLADELNRYLEIDWSLNAAPWFRRCGNPLALALELETIKPMNELVKELLGYSLSHLDEMLEKKQITEEEITMQMLLPQSSVTEITPGEHLYRGVRASSLSQITTNPVTDDFQKAAYSDVDPVIFFGRECRTAILYAEKKFGHFVVNSESKSEKHEKHKTQQAHKVSDPSAVPEPELCPEPELKAETKTKTANLRLFDLTPKNLDILILKLRIQSMSLLNKLPDIVALKDRLEAAKAEVEFKLSNEGNSMPAPMLPRCACYQGCVAKRQSEIDVLQQKEYLAERYIRENILLEARLRMVTGHGLTAEEQLTFVGQIPGEFLLWSFFERNFKSNGNESFPRTNGNRLRELLRTDEDQMRREWRRLSYMELDVPTFGSNSLPDKIDLRGSLLSAERVLREMGFHGFASRETPLFGGRTCDSFEEVSCFHHEEVMIFKEFARQRVEKICESTLKFSRDDYAKFLSGELKQVNAGALSGRLGSYPESLADETLE